MGFPGRINDKELAVNVGDIRDVGSSIHTLGRFPGVGMATHSSILAWRIHSTEEPGGLYSPWGHKESDTTEATWHAHTFKYIYMKLCF